MKIRLLEHLVDRLNADLAWRKKELSFYKGLLSSSSIGSAQREALIRSSIVMAYAHWEGYVKGSAEAYLEYVSRKKLKNEELAMNFLAISAKSKLVGLTDSSKALIHNEAVKFFIEQGSDRASIPYSSLVNTRSNLKFNVFENIMLMIGIDYRDFITKANLIDRQLVHNRNNIANGRYLTVDTAEAIEVIDQVIAMLSIFRNSIDNAASLEVYKL